MIRSFSKRMLYSPDQYEGHSAPEWDRMGLPEENAASSSPKGGLRPAM